MRHQRVRYARENAGRYFQWAHRLCSVPARDLAEFALISVQCYFDRAIAGWQASRGLYGEALVKALSNARVSFPAVKAQALTHFRLLAYSPQPTRAYRDASIGLYPGLGIAKLSFAICLAYPFTSEVVCVDRHMARAYGAASLTKGVYCRVESDIINEAQEAELPPFLYQWAIWDLYRGRPESHAGLSGDQPVQLILL